MQSLRFARAVRRSTSTAPARTLPRAAPGVVGAFAAGAAAATYGLYQIREFARVEARCRRVGPRRVRVGGDGRGRGGARSGRRGAAVGLAADVALAKAIALARRPAFEADVRAAFDATVAEWASGLGDAATAPATWMNDAIQLTTARDADAPPPAAAAATPAEAPEDAPPPEGAPPPPRAGWTSPKFNVPSLKADVPLGSNRRIAAT
ncbi:hypothetical protein JL720_10430 [Aureococcus anophagefferens]|nr:hypothetical protein JL720_10430 [Aureococcus anophagefferens]